jgi:hypothetical protein
MENLNNNSKNLQSVCVISKYILLLYRVKNINMNFIKTCNNGNNRQDSNEKIQTYDLACKRERKG